VRFDEPLARHTSLRVGGPADALARPASRPELADTVALARAHGAAVLLLGGGFNTLAPDAGVRGVVVQLRALGELEREGDEVRAGAGVTHGRAVRFCADAGLAGLEFAVGIPGTVGGWLAMNAGIPEREMKDVVTAVEWLDPATGAFGATARADLRFRYRALEHPSGVILVAARFGLAPGDRGAIRARMRELMERRRRTQPVDELSCGSVFVNPPGDHAGRLIEAAGLKGAREGGAEISTLHANFIVNRGGASAADVLALIERARSAVRERFGVALETEVKVLGGAA
jgi:UDP-N-acetylmuramate dehydrogenase